MNDSPDTAVDLIAAGTELFADRGYDAASVRAITRRAGANLGAITYHFGTKETLYAAVFASVVEPSHAYLVREVGSDGTFLERIARFVRAMFRFLHQHPEFPRLIMQHLAGSRPLPPAGQRTMQGNIQLLASLIAGGQKDGSIRPGNPLLMALSIGAQPMFLTLIRRALRDATAIDQDDPETRQRLVGSVVQYVLAGLVSRSEDQQ